MVAFTCYVSYFHPWLQGLWADPENKKRKSCPGNVKMKGLILKKVPGTGSETKMLKNKKMVSGTGTKTKMLKNPKNGFRNRDRNKNAKKQKMVSGTGSETKMLS